MGVVRCTSVPHVPPSHTHQALHTLLTPGQMVPPKQAAPTVLSPVDPSHRVACARTVWASSPAPAAGLHLACSLRLERRAGG